MSQLYSNIRKFRIQRGLTQDELAEKMGYRSKSTIAKIESGKNDIPQSKIKDFADALSVSISDLMGIEENDTVQVHIMDFHGKEPEIITIPREKFEKMQRLLRAYEAEEEREKKNDPGIF